MRTFCPLNLAFLVSFNDEKGEFIEQLEHDPGRP